MLHGRHAGSWTIGVPIDPAHARRALVTNSDWTDDARLLQTAAAPAGPEARDP